MNSEDIRWVIAVAIPILLGGWATYMSNRRSKEAQSTTRFQAILTAYDNLSEKRDRQQEADHQRINELERKYDSVQEELRGMNSRFTSAISVIQTFINNWQGNEKPKVRKRLLDQLPDHITDWWEDE